MLKTGTVPVSDEIHRLPAAANGESKLQQSDTMYNLSLISDPVKGKAPVHVEEDDEEEELRKLQAEMAM